MRAAEIAAAVWLLGIAAWTPICIALSVWVKEKQPGRVWLGGSVVWSCLMLPLACGLALLGLVFP